MSDSQLTILGCGAAMPTVRHNPSAQVFGHRGRLFLIDCGEGTQLQYRRLGLKPGRMQHIFLSHLHGDHCLGLFGLLSTLRLLFEREGEVVIHAPSGAERIFPPMFDAFCRDLPFAIRIIPFRTDSSELIYEDKSLTVKTIPLKHSVPVCGFLFEEKPPLRHLLGDMAEYYAIPHYKRAAIKAGEDFVLPDGTLIPNERLTRPAAPAVRYAYCSDTAYDERIVPLIEGVDLLYHEATYADDCEPKAISTLHSTARQAARIARMAGVKRLMLGHFSARYDDESFLLQQAREVFPDTILANEGLKYNF